MELDPHFREDDEFRLHKLLVIPVKTGIWTVLDPHFSEDDVVFREVNEALAFHFS